jgi:hypothetical protein
MDNGIQVYMNEQTKCPLISSGWELDFQCMSTFRLSAYIEDMFQTHDILIMAILYRPEWVVYRLYYFNFDPYSVRCWRRVSRRASRTPTYSCRTGFKPVWCFDVDRTTSDSLNIMDDLIRKLDLYWLVLITNSEPDV